MIITCNGCETKYLLGDDKVQPGGMRVRCPKCRFVWRLAAPASEPAQPAAESIFQVSSNLFSSDAPMAEKREGGWNSGGRPAAAVIDEPGMEEMHAEVEISDIKPEPVEQTAPESPELRKKKERAKRLARVFVSDLLVYNKEKRDQGLAKGDLMTVLGPEIKKAWEAYKEKIGTEVIESSDYFRGALNEILADGQKIF